MSRGCGQRSATERPVRSPTAGAVATASGPPPHPTTAAASRALRTARRPKALGPGGRALSVRVRGGLLPLPGPYRPRCGEGVRGRPRHARRRARLGTDRRVGRCGIRRRGAPEPGRTRLPLAARVRRTEAARLPARVRLRREVPGDGVAGGTQQSDEGLLRRVHARQSVRVRRQRAGPTPSRRRSHDGRPNCPGKCPALRSQFAELRDKQAQWRAFLRRSRVLGEHVSLATVRGTAAEDRQSGARTRRRAPRGRGSRSTHRCRPSRASPRGRRRSRRCRGAEPQGHSPGPLAWSRAAADAGGAVCCFSRFQMPTTIRMPPRTRPTARPDARGVSNEIACCVLT